MKLTKTQEKVLAKLAKNTACGQAWLHIEYNVDGPRMLRAAGQLVRMGILKAFAANGIIRFERV
jgi:hypothetical protein